ncbi:MAG: glycosyltransferase [Gemmatimonadales bacterium]
MSDSPTLPQAVSSAPMMLPPTRRLYLALTLLALLIIAGFAGVWLALGPGSAPFLYAVASGLVAFQVASWLSRWLLLSRMRRPIHVAPEPGLRVAVVTTFVPGREPIQMLEQVVRSLVALEYEHDTWVLDEGDDPDVGLLCARLGARHFSRRGGSTDDPRLAPETKYGNYNAWLDRHGAAYDVLAAFDPDHVAEPGYLVRALGHLRDPQVGYVQAPQAYYNQRVSFIARGAAEESYAFYATHQPASYGLGHPIIVGCHNVHRMKALCAVGGFAPHDADDLLLTLRYRSQGWRGVYVPELLAFGITPVDWHGYLRQQVRWSRSVVDLKLGGLRQLGRTLPRVERWLSALHGLFYLRSFTVPLWYLVLAGSLLAGRAPTALGLSGLLALMVTAAGLRAIGSFRLRFALDPRTEGGLHWRAGVLQLAKWPFQCLAIVRGLVGSQAPYALTYKVHPIRGGWPTLWPHGLVALLMAVVLGVARAWHGHQSLLLEVAGAAVILASITLIVTESQRRLVPAWEAGVYLDRRRELDGLLGPARWPSVDRRRIPRPASAR